MNGHSHAEPYWPYSGRGHRDPQEGCHAIEANHLYVTYARNANPVVINASFQVAVGERIALIGPNGAGKSTLLKSIAGLLQPQSGEIRIYGNRVGDCHHRTAYLPQRSDLDWLFPITVEQLVMTGRFVHLGWFRRPGRHDYQHVAVALERLGIDRVAKHQIGDLSGGQQQRTLLARALVQEASLFLLDEPLNAVDESTRDIVDDVLLEHTRRGGSVLVATHDLGRLKESFDRSIYLRDGVIERTESLQDTQRGPSETMLLRASL